MNTVANVGIDNIGYYIPKLRLSVQKILLGLTEKDPELIQRMYNAVKTTGQKFMRITQHWQDSVCLAAESLRDLINNISVDTIRFLISATETSVDASKPIAAYLLGILQKTGVHLPKNLSTYQAQHACAGGIIGLLQSLSMILTSKREASALLSMTDIARYERNSTAEITQGAGAVSVYICKNPRLLELDAECVGLHSEDTDDFFRPMNSKTAKVRGRYSMKCYLNSIYSSLVDYTENSGKTVEQVLRETDYFFFHLPFANMSCIVLEHIFKRKLQWQKQHIDDFIEDKYIHVSSEIIANIGNTYTASTFFSLGYLLCKQYQKLKENIVGKKVLLLTYGSGSTSVVLAGRIASKATEIIRSWSLLAQLNNFSDIDLPHYAEWHQNDDPSPPLQNDIASLTPKSIYFEAFREDGYRVYQQVP